MKNAKPAQETCTKLLKTANKLNTIVYLKEKGNLSENSYYIKQKIMPKVLIVDFIFSLFE